MNVKRLAGALLNFWIAKAAGLQLAPTEPKPGNSHDPDSGFWHPVTYCPANDWYCPSPHTVHRGELAPRAAEYDPMGHSAHASRPVSELKRPSAHKAHTVWPI